MRNDIGKFLSNKEAGALLGLVFHSNFKTGESHVTHKKLIEVTGFPETTLKRYLNTLEENSYIEKHSFYSGKTPTGQPRQLTEYHVYIPDTHYIMVDRKLLDLKIGDLPLKEQSAIKGFILMLKCVCLNFTDTTLYSYSELAERLNISRPTINNLMQQCKEYDLVSYDEKKGSYTIREGLFINGYPPIVMPKNESEYWKGIYKAIYEFCKTKRVICPPYDSRYVSIIAYIRGNGERITELLEERIKELPNEISSLNYFIQVMRGKKLESEPEKPKTVIYLD